VIERAYSDPAVAMVLHNLFVLSAGESRKIESSAGRTGVSLFISEHYREDREKDLKEKRIQASAGNTCAAWQSLTWIQTLMLVMQQVCV